jgi:hypothetical protein
MTRDSLASSLVRDNPVYLVGVQLLDDDMLTINHQLFTIKGARVDPSYQKGSA